MLEFLLKYCDLIQFGFLIIIIPFFRRIAILYSLYRNLSFRFKTLFCYDNQVYYDINQKFINIKDIDNIFIEEFNKFSNNFLNFIFPFELEYLEFLLFREIKYNISCNINKDKFGKSYTKFPMIGFGLPKIIYNEDNIIKYDKKHKMEKFIDFCFLQLRKNFDFFSIFLIIKSFMFAILKISKNIKN